MKIIIVKQKGFSIFFTMNRITINVSV